MTDKKALGRGLAALIPSGSMMQDALSEETKSRMKYFVEEKDLREGKNIISIAIDAIRPNRFQPRKTFKDDKRIKNSGADQKTKRDRA